MGKMLLINGADFYENRVSTVISEETLSVANLLGGNISQVGLEALQNLLISIEPYMGKISMLKIPSLATTVDGACLNIKNKTVEYPVAGNGNGLKLANGALWDKEAYDGTGTISTTDNVTYSLSTPITNANMGLIVFTDESKDAISGGTALIANFAGNLSMKNWNSIAAGQLNLNTGGSETIANMYQCESVGGDVLYGNAYNPFAVTMQSTNVVTDYTINSLQIYGKNTSTYKCLGMRIVAILKGATTQEAKDIYNILKTFYTSISDFD